jgi:hypothetical protein
MSESVKDKKRKVAEVQPAEEQQLEIAPEIATFATSLDLLKTTGPLYYSSLADYLTDTVSNGRDVSEILASTYIKSAAMENRFLVPPEFGCFTVSRGPRGEVDALIDKVNKKKLSGHRLEKVLAYYAFKLKGVKASILQTGDDGVVQALTVPDGVQFKDLQSSDDDKPWYGNLRVMYTPKQRSVVYASAESLEKIIALRYMAITDVKEVCCALNILQGKEDISDIDPGKLSSFKDIESAIKADNTKRAKQTFLESILACKMKAATAEEMIQHFTSSPSYYLSQRCAFRLPHNGALFIKMENKRSNTVQLSTLKDDDEVLLRSNIMSQSEYLNIRGDPASILVHKDGPELGARKNGKWKEFTGKKTMSASLVKQMLTAISKANETTKSASVPEVVVDEDKADLSFSDDDLSV